MLCRRLAVIHGMRWQETTMADIFPLLCDVADRQTPEEETATARRLTAMGILQEVTESG